MHELQQILDFIVSVLFTSIIYTNFLKLTFNMPIYNSNTKTKDIPMKKIYDNALIQLSKRLDLNLISLYTYIKVSSFIHSRLLVLKFKEWK